MRAPLACAALMCTSEPPLVASVREALVRRGPLLDSLHSDHTDTYRLFHGATEGAPGVTLDRYGDLLMLQSFREPLAEVESVLPLLEDLIHQHLGQHAHNLTPIYHNDRRANRHRRADPQVGQHTPP